MVIPWDSTNWEEGRTDIVSCTAWNTVLAVILRAVFTGGIRPVGRLVTGVLSTVVVVSIATKILHAAIGGRVAYVVSPERCTVGVDIAAAPVRIPTDPTQRVFSRAVGFRSTTW